MSQTLLSGRSISDATSSFSYISRPSPLNITRRTTQTSLGGIPKSSPVSGWLIIAPRVATYEFRVYKLKRKKKVFFISSSVSPLLLLPFPNLPDAFASPPGNPDLSALDWWTRLQNSQASGTLTVILES